MKKNVFIVFCLSAIFGVSLVSCNSSNESQNKQSENRMAEVTSETPPKEEAIINLALHPVAVDAADWEFATCNARLKWKNAAKLKRLVDSVLISEIDVLKEEAKTAAENMCDSVYITCLKINFGWDSIAQKMELVYCPGYACKVKDSILTGGKHLGAFQLTSTGNKYRYVANAFIPYSGNELELSYKRNIRIDKHKTGHFSPYVERNDSTSDVSGLIYSFQEIDSLVSANAGTTKIKIFNSASTYKLKGITDSCVKHTLLLGPYGFNPSYTDPHKNRKNTGTKPKTREEVVYILDFMFDGKYANLAHLCPPNCSRLIYCINN